MVCIAHATATPMALSAADCLVVCFYYLLRPGKYAGNPRHACDDLFHLQDVGMWVGSRKLDALLCPLPDLVSANTLACAAKRLGILDPVTPPCARSSALCPESDTFACNSLQAPPLR